MIIIARKLGGSARHVKREYCCTIKWNHHGRHSIRTLHALERVRHACKLFYIYKYSCASGKISVDRYLVPGVPRPFTELPSSRNQNAESRDFFVEEIKIRKDEKGEKS